MSNKIEILLVYRQRNVIASFYLLQIAITVSFLFVAGGCWFIVMALIIVRSPDTRPEPDAGADIEEFKGTPLCSESSEKSVRVCFPYLRIFSPANTGSRYIFRC